MNILFYILLYSIKNFTNNNVCINSIIVLRF